MRWNNLFILLNINKKTMTKKTTILLSVLLGVGSVLMLVFAAVSLTTANPDCVVNDSLTVTGDINAGDAAGDQVKAYEYCDENGIICFKASDICSLKCPGICMGCDNTGACVTQTTGWGDNFYNCVGVNKRCDAGACVTCGGYVATDGLGGSACWYYAGAVNISCDTVCATHGGCVVGNWNDGDNYANCAVGKHFDDRGACGIEGGSYAPSTSVVWNKNSSRNIHNTQSCSSASGCCIRLCNCYQ